MTWGGYAAVFAAFFLTHSLPLRPAVRRRLVAVLGPRGFGIGYSALSLAMLAALVAAADRAPFVMLWPQAPWQVAAVQAGMAAVLALLALSLGRPNPLSFGGARNDRFDPARPGLVRVIRHPVLVALALWAGLHMLPNGDLAHVILFGTLGAFALAGGRIVDRRKHRDMGERAWQAIRADIACAPLGLAWVRDTVRPLRIAVAVAAYAAIILLHPVVVGVAAR